MRPRFTENHFYIIAFLVALGVRLLNLGTLPLADSEAQWAMQALTLGRGAVEIGAQPGYVILTGLLFNLVHATNTLARLLPALLGSLIVFFPALLSATSSRLNFSRTAAIVLAFGLALDPTLAVTSRQAGSSMPAVTCLVLALAAVYARRPIMAGIFSGLALLSGPTVFAGALGLTLAYGLISLLQKADWIMPLGSDDEELPPISEENPTPPQNPFRLGLYALVSTILVMGTLFLAYPLGLSGLAASLTSYLAGWRAVSAISPVTPLAALLVYETLPLIFGLVGILFAWLRRDALAQRLSIWLVASLILVIIYPARQVGDLTWALIPLWALAAWALAHTLQPAPEESALRQVSLLQALFLFVLLIVLRLNLLGWQNYGVEQSLMLLLSAGVIVMGIIATIMVAIGWSGSLARDGVVSALVAAGTLSLLAATFWGTQARMASTYELWDTPPAAGQVDLVTKTLHYLSVSKTGLENAIDIVSVVDSPSMHWALREFPNTRFVNQLAITEQPSIVITWQNQAELESSSSYLGQDFVWDIYPAWQGGLPTDWLPWLAFRQAPLAPSAIILWARGDLFPAAIIEE